ncbi:MAG: efflux pump, family, outer membrane protein [Myxococcaceae bacterium]|nr:efflux pump, family, outer membrane protein [Myxococcaceae bacterium]
MNALLLAVLLAADPPTQPAAAELVPTPTTVRRMTLEDCVREALKESGTLLEARGKVTEWQGKLLEVESVYWPKLQGLAYIAPVYGLTLSPGASLTDQPHPRYDTDLGKWGPYTKLQLTLAQPLYTFGRQPAGEKAAQNRLEVERARYLQVRNTLALEVRRYYYLHLFARSMQPALDQAKSILDEAQVSAQESYAEANGSVTQVDLAKLKYGGSLLAKGLIQAQIGQALALAALKHSMGMAQSTEIQLVEEALPPLPDAPLPPLKEFVARAALNRPEMAQIKYGMEAAKWFARSEELSSMPTAFVAFQLDLNWSPLRPTEWDPFAYDRFNSITPGIAAGLLFDVDPRKTWARAKGAYGLIEQVEGLKKFAESGIPVEVRQAYDDATQADQLTRLSGDGSAAGRKWMVFAGTAYVAGTGEAKDLLEGLVVYLTARQAYFEGLQASHFARARLLYVTGETGVD